MSLSKNQKKLGLRSRSRLARAFGEARVGEVGKEQGLGRYFMLGSVIFFTGIIPSAALPTFYYFFPAETPLYFVALYYAFFVLWILVGVFNIFREKGQPILSSKSKPKLN